MKNLKDINWNQLYAFYEVAKVQSLKEGAKNLRVSPSTLSEQLKKLEDKFQTTFFVRSSKGLTLNIEGAKLFERAKGIFEEGNKLLEHYSQDTVGGYAVSIGIEETVSTDLSTEFASQYWDLYTQYGSVNTVKQVSHESLVDNLLQNNIDWGISVRKPKRRSVDFAEIGSFEIVFCCSSELFEKFKDKKDILINIPFVESSWDQKLNKLIYKYLRSQSVIPKEKICSDHIGFVKNLCNRGRCVMYIPFNPLENYDGLKVFKLDEPIKISLYAIWKKSDESLISIKLLKQLIQSKISTVPLRYEDVDLQIEVSDVAENKLR
jgi:DNA-binding transcriptional LysR family regulator